jgi:hypothetical protein
VKPREPNLALPILFLLNPYCKLSQTPIVNVNRPIQ